MNRLLLLIKPGSAIDEQIETPGGHPEPPLDVLQALVGGYIELLPRRIRYQGRDRMAYVNEDGLAKRLPYNSRATFLFAGQIVGPMVLDMGDQP